MKYAIVLTTLLALQITLRWNSNTEPDLAGYRLYARAHGDSYNYTAPIWTGNATTATVEVPTHSAFVVRAFDESGLESENSNEVTTWDGKPKPPFGCIIETVFEDSP